MSSALPNRRSLIWPQLSTLPVVAGVCASGLVRLQSGMKFPFKSHERVTDGGKGRRRRRESAATGSRRTQDC